jgi:hypothetical protein
MQASKKAISLQKVKSSFFANRFKYSFTRIFPIVYIINVSTVTKKRNEVADMNGTEGKARAVPHATARFLTGISESWI